VRVTDPATGIVTWSPWYLVYSAAFALVALIGSTLLFHRSQYRFAEYL
jgi:hypothetical protein